MVRARPHCRASSPSPSRRPRPSIWLETPSAGVEADKRSAKVGKFQEHSPLANAGVARITPSFSTERKLCPKCIYSNRGVCFLSESRFPDCCECRTFRKTTEALEITPVPWAQSRAKLPRRSACTRPVYLPQSRKQVAKHLNAALSLRALFIGWSNLLLPAG